MNILIIKNIIKKENDMEFFTLHDFMTYSKGITYLIMGAILVFMPIYWLYLTDRDD